MKPLIITCILSGSILCLWVIGRLTRALRLCRASTSSSEPTLKPGELFITTNLKTLKRFDLIAYRAVLPATGMTTLIHRICGMPGDMVEIKAGVLYVNGEDADRRLILKHVYKVATEDSGSIEYKSEDAYTIPPYTDTLYIPLEARVVKAGQLPCTRYVLPAGLRDEAVYRVYRKSWNGDNFGPLRIPADKYFVLGDNRGKSQDSRHLGLVDQKKIKGIVLWK